MSDEITYEIQVKDVLDEKWSAYFAPFALTTVQEGTILTGSVQDQAELFGVLLKIRDLGITLISLVQVPER